jgi:protein-S-isoprenylcysteine O-methyltransferase Ste14
VIDGRIIAVCWIAFVGYWLVSSRDTKRTIDRGGERGVVLRVLAILALVAVGNSHAIGLHGPHTSPDVDRALGAIGVVLCAGGIAFAIWARAHLGRNWGMPMSVKDDPELITSGPYRLVRHPIYTGVVIALMGTALVVGLRLWIVAAAFFAYLLYSASHEEREMTRRFPDRYPEYRAHTKKLVPYIL